MGAAIYFLGLFSGMTVTVLIAGYVLLMEENIWLKKTAIKAVALWVLFALINAVLGLVPEMIGFVNSIVSIFGGSFYLTFVSNVIYMLRDGLDLIKTVLFLLLGLKALNQGSVRVPVIDKLIDKCLE